MLQRRCHKFTFSLCCTVRRLAAALQDNIAVESGNLMKAGQYSISLLHSARSAVGLTLQHAPRSGFVHFQRYAAHLMLSNLLFS